MFASIGAAFFATLIWLVKANEAAPPPPPPKACFASWVKYSSISRSLGEQTYTTTLTSTDIWSAFPSVPTSTFCDNIPRLLSRQYTEYVTEWYPTTTYTTWSSMTSPTPTCRVNEGECATLMSMWNVTHTTETSMPEFPVPCTTYRPCPSDPIGPCSILGENMKIYYWPTPATEPFCPQNTTLLSTTRPAPTSPPSMPKPPVVKVIDGLTVTSPSIYISIPTLYGKFHGQPTYHFTGCGSLLTSLTLSIPPSPLSTFTRQRRAKRPTYENPSPFTLTSLNWPVTTTSSCSVQTYCDWDDKISICIDVLSTKCTTPTADPFNWNPVLSLPTELVKMAAKQDPGYLGCDILPAAAAGGTWIPITTLPGDPRYTKGWSASSTIAPFTVTATAAAETTSTSV
ncbi:hypothetical protein BCR34DRAFT_617333 [Clohesyomyces aquaticus]|uniref:Uncharacterized protein n=1 Tax=Clohesyomyces aquaticus TaxID=1231657 RepID=A0A1Y1Z3Y9_9PLEO|nr:hypothetical protein BCR34DRAFT_617333 [Clohesyomyces aquaticus]